MKDNIEQKVKITYDTNAEKASKDVNKLDKSVEKTTESQKKSKKATDSQKGSLEDLGGGLGRAITGFKGLITQAWALVANPVGAIIAAIALSLMVLFKAFTSTKGGAEKFDQIMAGISATIDVVRDRVLKVADALVKFLSGDFSGAMADAKSAVSGFGAEVAREFQIAADAKKSLQEVADTMRDLGVQRAKLNRDLVEAKEIIESETATYKEKKEAIDSVKKAEEEQTIQELANAQKKLDAIIAQNAQSDSGSEELQAQADAETALFNIQQKSAEDRIKNIKLTKKADNEEESRLKEISTKRKAAAAERAKLAEEERKEVEKIANLKISEEQKVSRAIEDLEDKTEEQKLSRKKARDLEAIEQLKTQGVDVRNLLIYNDELYKELENELIEKRRLEKEQKQKEQDDKDLEAKKVKAAKEKEIDDAMLAQTKAIEDAKINILRQGIRLIADVFGKSKAIQKAAIIAENAVGIGKMIIDNNRANIGALATPQAIASSGAAAAPVIAINNITTGLGVASSIAATAKALKAVGGGSAGGGGGSAGGASGGRGASAAPQVGFQASSENQLATTISQNANDQQPIEAFVVESTITTAQAAARRRLQNNSF
jgi:hypothetical protein